MRRVQMKLSEMAPQKLEPKVDDKRPFRMPWLDSSYQETLLPTGSWQKVTYYI